MAKKKRRRKKRRRQRRTRSQDSARKTASAAAPAPVPPEPDPEPEPEPEPVAARAEAESPDSGPAPSPAALDGFMRPVALEHVQAGPVEYIPLEAVAPAGRRGVGSPGRPAQGRAPGLRQAFARGALVGVLLIPAIAAVLYGLARWGIGNQQAGFALTLVRTAMFAGPPAVLIAGGIGRAAAQIAARPGAGSQRRAVHSAAMSTALISVGLCVLAAVPLDAMPPNPVRWLWLVASGLLVGALGGVALGRWIASLAARAS